MNHVFLISHINPSGLDRIIDVVCTTMSHAKKWIAEKKGVSSDDLSDELFPYSITEHTVIG